MSDSFIFWQRWLLLLSMLIVLFGLFMALANSSALFDLLNSQIDPVFWDEQALPQEAIAFRSWSYSLTGATMAGWGIFFIFLIQYGLRNRQKWAWNCLLIGMLVWYLPDTGMSLAYGVTFNAFFNSFLLLLVLVPLLAIRKSFRQTDRH